MANICVVDDKEILRGSLCEALTREDHSVTTFADPLEALAEIPALIERHRDPTGATRLAGKVAELEQATALAELEFLAGEVGALASSGACLAIGPVVNAMAPRPGDWPREIQAMYAAWAHRKGYEVETVETDGGRELRLAIRGPNVAEILGGEAGLHRAQRADEAPGSRPDPALSETVSYLMASLEHEGLLRAGRRREAAGLEGSG